MNIVGGLSDRSVDSEFLSAESTTGTHAGTSGGNGSGKGAGHLCCWNVKQRLTVLVIRSASTYQLLNWRYSPQSCEFAASSEYREGTL